MVDPNGETYLVSKVTDDLKARLYHLPKTAWGSRDRVNLTDGVALPVHITSGIKGPVAGDISHNGHEVTNESSLMLYCSA